MTVALDAFTFYHPDPHGGPHRASSVIGPRPVDAGSAHELALQQTGYDRSPRFTSNKLDFAPVSSVAEVVAKYERCAGCHLCHSRQRVSHSRGDRSASVVFMGGSPSHDDNDSSEPFIGSDGKLQEVISRSNGIDPARVLWMNMLGCRSAGHWAEDRTPMQAELAACSERVFMMLSVVRPRVVICLGDVATKYFFTETPPIWNYTKFTPPGHSEDWIMVGHAQHPQYLVKTMGAPSNYRQFAAQRTFYSMLASYVPTLTRVNTWRFFPQQARLQQPEVAWHK